MAFGRLGAAGTGFGRLGSSGSGGGVAAAAGGAALLVGEANGFATDFQYATDGSRVAVKTAGVVVESGLDAFYSNAGTSPKQVYDVAGVLGWSPHNMLLQSQTFDNASWTKQNGTVTANATAAPDGTTTADAFIINAGTVQAWLSQSVSIIVGSTYTFSAYLKNGTLGNNWVFVDVTTATISYQGWFNLATGAKGTSANSPVSYNITDAGSGWYKVDLTVVGGGTANSFLRPSSANGSTGTVTGNGTSPTFYAWGGQLNRGTVPTAYLPTTTAARYGLAIDYDPVTHAPKGLLVEPAATNLLLQSAAPATQGVTVTAVAHTLSFFGTGTLTLTGTSTAGPLVGTGANNRVSLTFTPTAGTLTLTKSGTVTQAQLETGTVATSYIPTLAAAVTRGADSVSFLLSTIPALGTEWSLYSRFSMAVLASSRYGVHVSDGTTAELVAFGSGAPNTVFLHVLDGGVTQTNAASGNIVVVNVPNSAAARIKANDLAFSADGGAVVLDPVGTLPTVTGVRFGVAATPGVTLTPYHIAKLAIITDRGWSNAELATKSAS